MEENKNNKALIWLIIFLMILVLGLVGFIIYDKLLSNDNNSINETNTTTTTKENIIKENVFKSYPEKNDDNILSFNLGELSSGDKVDLTKNFQNIKLKKGNIEYKISCTEYNEENIEILGYACSAFEILINNVKLNDYISEGGQNFRHIIVNEDYLLEHVYSNISRCGYIKIFKNGELIYTIKDTITEINLNGNSFDSIMKYKNNNLYYFVQTKDSNKNYNVLKMIDFNKTKIVESEIERKEIENDLDAICYDYSSEFQ